MNIKCLQCNKELTKHQTLPCFLKKGGGKYCSKHCRMVYMWANKKEQMLERNAKNMIARNKSEIGRKKTSEWAKTRTGIKSHFFIDGRAINKPLYNKTYRKENLDMFRKYAENRRVRKFNAQGSYSLEQWEELKNKFNLMCLCCKRYEPEIKLTVDHIVPLTMGGTNSIENIQPLCGSCNSRKNVKTIDYKLTLIK